MAALAALAGDPNYICRCQSVVNNPESPPRPASATIFHSSYFVSRISSASSVTARMLAQFMAWGWQQCRGRLVGHISGEGCMSMLHYYPAITSPAHCCYLPSTNRSSPGDQSGGSLVIILVQEFTVFLPTTAAKELIIYLWLGNFHQKFYLYLKLSIYSYYSMSQ